MELTPNAAAQNGFQAASLTDVFLIDFDEVLASANAENGVYILGRVRTIASVLHKMHLTGDADAICDNLQQFMRPVIETYCAPTILPDELHAHVSQLRDAIRQQLDRQAPCHC